MIGQRGLMRFGQGTIPTTITIDANPLTTAEPLQVTPTAQANVLPGGTGYINAIPASGGGGILTNIFGDVTRAGSSYLTAQEQTSAAKAAAAAKATQTANLMPLFLIGGTILLFVMFGKH